MNALFDKYSQKLKKIVSRSIRQKNYEKAVAAMSAYSDICYQWNQFYADDEIESAACEISRRLWAADDRAGYSCVKKTVLFYDGFGLDTRGLALIYLKALTELNYEIIYVTGGKSNGKQPQIMSVLSENNAKIHYINNYTSYLIHMDELKQVFELYKPEFAFFYTLPYDVAGAIVFHHFDGLVKRYLINLTDHAFWIGKCAIDHCLEFRDYGVGISVYNRKIEREKLRILPFYPDIDKSVAYQGLSLPQKSCLILFSGGALYKTKSEDNRYFRLIDKILSTYENTVFVYAGEGFSAELNGLSKAYPRRMFQIPERSDLYAFMEHIDIYINTYPLAGGLMTQYAAAAGKVPLTLLANDEGSFGGLLKDQDHLNIQFTAEENLLQELDQLIKSKDYRISRGEQLKGSCYTKQEFVQGLEEVLTGRMKSPEAVQPIKTVIFQRGYEENFNGSMCLNAIAYKKNKSLILNYPNLFIKRCCIRIHRKLIGARGHE